MAEAPLREVADGQPVLEVRGVCVSFGPLRVLDSVDLDVQAGQLVALTGENGAGKSTLVRCIAGDLAPGRGEILVDGERVGSRRRASTNLAVVRQDLSLCDNLDVASNLFLGDEGGSWLVSDSANRRASRRLLAQYRIDVGDVGRRVGELSGGQRQMVAVAGALRTHPRLLVLDEPTTALGVREAAQLSGLIEQVHREGTAVLLVSHDVDQILDLADRIVVLRAGRIVGDVRASGAYADDVLALMTGRRPEATARRQLTRFHGMFDQLATATRQSGLRMVLSALCASLHVEHVCIHIAEGGGLRLAASLGLPPDLQAAWAALPCGPAGGPIGVAAELGRAVVCEDARTSAEWEPLAAGAVGAGVRGSWSVPIGAAPGARGVLTACLTTPGRPRREQLDVASLYAGAIGELTGRERLVAQLTERNRVLETIRAVLETLGSKDPVAVALLRALRSLQRGLRAQDVQLWIKPAGHRLRCRAYVSASGEMFADPTWCDPADAERCLAELADSGDPTPLGSSRARPRVMGAHFETPGERIALLARWEGAEIPEDARALIGDAGNSVRLALERERAEEAQQEAETFRRSHELQRDFLSRLNHELRTPLTAIQGYASSLLAQDVTWDEASRTRFVRRIEAESARLGRLVGELMDVSAIESGMLHLESDWCELPLVMRAAIACLPPAQALRVDLEASPDVPLVWADHDRMEQVFLNLFDNSFRHNHADVHVRAGISVEPVGTVAVRVQDDGVGIPRQMAADLDRATGRGAGQVPGMGLGLATAVGVVRAHGGTITAEPRERGACFVVRLPVDGPTER